ncbi:gliding motility-associated-like protein [Filimonas zeae]|uniref:PKD domain-containing protein n=1 Tax=Filimonas zeae TaxID=1737353 RepID=A0A917J2F0_9BACT|nr:PKD domain-containing protein [Filimonas zeae]MDR6342014.1 gliding motility-associated-like protein [Filimonas zeae]GGH79452.1 hypothetical protein GCM10011379_48840 [Filimonas zeae]
MNRWIRCILVCLLCAAFYGKAAAQGLSNRGKEFWVGYGLHQFMEWPGDTNAQDMVLYFSAEDSAEVTVTVRGRTANLVKVYKVPANTVIMSDRMPKDKGAYDCRLYDLPPSFGGTGGDGLFKVSIHISSNVPIVAYAHIYGETSSGATMLMPVETWGYSYTSLNSKQIYADNCFSFAYVVAQHDNTQVAITPSVLTRDGHLPGVTFNTTLNAGDIYQIVGANTGGGKGNELTGTTVKSVANDQGDCYPIAFFSGSSRTENPCEKGAGGGDNDMQQVFPYEAWGKRYYTAPTSSSNMASSFMTNMYKVVVKDAATVVKRNGKVLSDYDASSRSYYFESNKAEIIEADKPVLLAQFMSGGCLGAGSLGDPEMMFLSPVEQGIKRTGFYRNTEQIIQVNYLTLIIPKKGLASLTIDGKQDFSYSYTHPQDTNYMVVVKRWTSAKQQCLVSSDSAFTAVTYGLGGHESYGYNAGTLINNLNAVLSVRNISDTAQSHLFTCVNTPMKLSVLMAYMPTRLEWLLSEVSGLSPNTNVVQANPVPSAEVLYRGVTYYKYELPGTYQLSQAGIIDVPVRSTHPIVENCYHTEKILTSVIVKEPPFTPLTVSHTGCIGDSVYFSGSKNTANGFAITKWKWGFDDGAVADTGVAAKLYTTAGAHTETLRVVTAEGCVADTAFSITVNRAPELTIVIADTAICMGDTVRVSAVSKPGSSIVMKEWYWNMGNSIVSAASAPPPFVYDGFGSYRIKLHGKASATCVSDTVVQVVTVAARPVLSFTYPEGCLPETGIVKFVNTSAVPDGQAIVAHNWSFGDAYATPDNLNTATEPDPSHKYTRYGIYSVSYKATTAGGCVADTTVVTSFNVRPAFNYPQPAAVCESVQGVVPVTGAVVTNNVKGTGVYKGAGVDVAGNLSSSVAGAGEHTIWYVFTAESGCKDSVSATVTVYPRPVARFTMPLNVCVGTAAELKDVSFIADGALVQRNWNLGDGGTASYATATDFTKKYRDYGDYKVMLVVKSDKGCTGVDSFTTHVRQLPQVSFVVPEAICMPQGKAVFVNNTTIGEEGSLSYAWLFADDGSVSDVRSPEHTYVAAGSYAVRLTVTSAYGCIDSLTKQVAGFYNKPLAAFAVAPEQVCAGKSVSFTDASMGAGSAVVQWKWIFGDGTTAVQRNVDKRYDVAQTYRPGLVVTNAAGCVSDTAMREVVVHVQPTVDAGASVIATENEVVILNPVVSDVANVTYVWSPAALLNNARLLRPSYKAVDDAEFWLTVTGKVGGCEAADNVTVKVLKPVVIPNVFTPNGDGINDSWNITNLFMYAACTVTVFNRYGQQVYRSVGYTTPWNGYNAGGLVPVGTYYYIIDLRNGDAARSGTVTILK